MIFRNVSAGAVTVCFQKPCCFYSHLTRDKGLTEILFEMANCVHIENCLWPLDTSHGNRKLLENLQVQERVDSLTVSLSITLTCGW